jgi:hypothetical protein
MADDRPFTKDDAREFGQNLEKLVEAKLETMGERITGLRNWCIAIVGAAILVAATTATTHQAPAQNAKTAFALLTQLL